MYSCPCIVARAGKGQVNICAKYLWCVADTGVERFHVHNVSDLGSEWVFAHTQTSKTNSCSEQGLETILLSGSSRINST